MERNDFMATVSTLANMSNASYSGSTNSAASIKSKLESLESQLTEVESDNTLTANQKLDKQKDIQKEVANLNKEYAGLQMAQTNSSNASEVISLFGSLSGSGDSTNSTDTLSGILFGASSSYQNVLAINKARVTIEKEARTLYSEIQLDKARGITSADKQTKLSNLTSNLSILDSNLSNNIDSALEEVKADEEKLSVIDKIKQSLEANKTKTEESTADKTTEETTKTDTDA